ncbi:hypothetical protein [Streptomyces chromofuscus]|uniref:hypothetical protein n=1 Tax=Streptomyces chromofuscus TaxID=42881 RepID=UPI001676F1AB|nr:hypothetical protein [Streptomyces chromofuscus]
MISFLHVVCMRSISLSKPVLVAALGCVVLSGCGTQNATDQTPAGSAVSATTPLDAPHNDPETRFLELITRITLGCAPDAPNDKGDDVVPKPEDLPGWEEATPRYGAGETPPGVPNGDGDIPVPLPSDAPKPPESTPSTAEPKSLKEVPLTDIEKCSGSEHAKRLSEGFKNTKTTSYQAMHKKLTGLDYPASRIHQMPNHAGAPRARLDLRFIGSHLALEVTGTSSGVIIEAFGVPETEDVEITDVKRRPKLDGPTS